MDDLAGLDWNAKSNGNQQSRPPPSVSSLGTNVPSLRSSLANSPLAPQFPSRPGSSLSGAGPISSPGKAISPANDSFSSLLPSAGNRAKTSLTLQDRQAQLQQERQRQIQEQQDRHAKEAQLWNTLGNAPRSVPAAASSNGVKKEEDVDDILAAFSSSAKVDRSSHFPPPQSASQSGRNTPAMSLQTVQSNGMSNGSFDDDDDPFGLGAMSTSRTTQPAPSLKPLDIDDDFMGDLGKPVQPKPAARSPPLRHEEERKKANSTPMDRSIAELVDMGFPPEKARFALEETNGNMQSAVSFLLTQAHSESQSKAKGRPTERVASPAKSRTSEQDGVPAWMRSDSRPSSQPRRPDSSASNPDKDAAQIASEVGATFLKSANSLWKAGRKQVQKAVADFQQESGDNSQPKWMRDASSDSRRSATPSQAQPPSNDSRAAVSQADMTNEAMLLESGESRPSRPAKNSAVMHHEPPISSPLRGRSPAQVLPERSAPVSRFPQHPTAQPKQPTKLNREQVEEQASQAYVSASRRRPAKPKESPVEPEVDLFSPAPVKAATPISTQSSVARATSAPARPKAPPRNVPSVSPAALSQSAQHRAKGTEAFKRGDYDSAHQAYTAALAPLPPQHPITIIVLSNRALTAIKTGDPKLAIEDADKALAIIGPSRGENESIDMGGSEGLKDMKELYGKALMRKAEALEATEKWLEALAAWKLAVEAGTGGLVAVRGRDRCAKAASPKPAPAAAPVRKAAAAPAPSRPKPVSRSSNAAVAKLRAQNAAADKLDDEKFALTDAVSARVEGWRAGKSDNLRALLASLESVLWEGAGWKKVGMAELVLPGKCKVLYMKAIAKVHPDKIAQDATTEQKMISASVFATLNEAWDKFKNENGL